MWTDVKVVFIVEIAVAILELGLVRGKTVTSRDDVEEKEGAWLDDFAYMKNDYEFREMQADTPVGGDGEVDWSYQLDPVICPPPPKVRLSYSCEATACKSDQECGKYNQKCCYNGCVYTCMEAMSGPPYVDWKNTPRRPFSARNSWLITSENEVEEDDGQVEPCSTSAVSDDEDALLCPHGFLCHIEYLGDPEKGLPNRGRCIKQNDQLDSPHRKFRLKTDYHGQNVCVFKNAVFADGASFVFQKHPCECHDSSITCHVGKEDKTKQGQKKELQTSDS